MKRALILTVVLTPWLAACASNATMPVAKVALPGAYEAPKPAPPADPAVLDRWWDSYNDPQLSALVDEALTSSFDQRDALARLAQAAAIRREVFAEALPTSTTSAGVSHSKTDILSGLPAGATLPGGSTTYSASFNVSWELDLFGRVAQGHKFARADFEAARFTYEATRTALAANVAQSLLQARGLAIQLQDAEETVRIDQELARLADVRVSHGLSPSLDLDQAQANLGAAEAQAENLRAQLSNARRSLLLLLGRATDPLENLPVPASVGTPPAVPAVIPGELLARRPDVRSAEFQILSRAAQLKLAKLALFPTINLQPGATIAKTVGSFPSSSFFWTAGINATVPILDRPKLIAQIHEQHAVAEQVVIAYEKAVQTAYTEVENALVLLDSDQKRVAILVAAERHAQSAYEKARIGYARGLTDLQTALVAENTWRTIHSQMTAAQSTLMERSVQAFKAMGGGWTPEAPARTAPPEVIAGKG
jgi:NodT family efflux transporter outer membrane factor (OMF) lipoprotein